MEQREFVGGKHRAGMAPGLFLLPVNPNSLEECRGKGKHLQGIGEQGMG